MINGKIGEFNRKEERARGAGHDPVILSIAFMDVGVVAMGRLITRTVLGAKALVITDNEVLATGDGSIQVYSGTFENFPLEPQTIVITDGVETFTDDGFGRLKGDAGGTGTINYLDGSYDIDFNANVVNSTNVTVDYVTKVDGVNDEDLDTAQSGSSLCVVHGSVQKEVLKINDNGDAPSEYLLGLLTKNKIYAS
ncbi:MAG: hypothetical protein GY760_21190 [Deltaproteobacteria bacterium]|nr:hypothetical protein [Deltaproteobacteria bacterium]